MNDVVLRVAGYRLRATFRSRWGGYLTVVLLVGAVGGIGLAGLAGARRTQSSFVSFLASTNTADTGGITGVLSPQLGTTTAYDPALINRVAHLPHVRRVASYAGLNIIPIKADGSALDEGLVSPGDGSGSIDGEYFSVDHAVATHGRLADPARADEFDTDAAAAQLLHLHVGQSVRFGIYTNAQTTEADFGSSKLQPYATVEEKLVGLVVLNRSLVQDDVDAGVSLTSGLFTPALTRPYLSCCVNYIGTAVQVDSRRNNATVRREADAILPSGFPAFQDPTPLVAQAQRAIKPESVALGVFGGIALVAALVIGAQVVGRQLRLQSAERAVLRALGAGRATTGADALLGLVGAIVAGSVLAVGVAIGLSPLALIGPVRRVRSPSVALDWTVLLAGFAVLLVGLGCIGLAIIWRDAARQAEPPPSAGAGAGATRAAAAVGLPSSTVIGIRFAVEPGAGRATVPVRSAIAGSVMAMVVLAATVTFGASLHSLVSHPPLYGWNWDYAVAAGGGVGDLPAQQATALFGADKDLGAWSRVYFGTLTLDGTSVPVLGTDPGAAVQPPILSGHDLLAPDQVVLGAITLTALHKRVGDSVTVAGGAGPPTTLHIVGVGAMPAIGQGGLGHLEMGIGAVLRYSLIPDDQTNSFGDPIPGPNVVLVRFRPGINRTAAAKRLDTVANQLSNPANFGAAVVGVLRPAEIVNYRSMGQTPALLGGGLAAGAVTALGLTLVASVRRRRRDLAILKTLGFTRRQLRAAVAWQAVVATAVGAVIGLPIGVAVGRQLWDAFAREIHAVPAPSAPVATIALVGVGGLVLAWLVSLVPGAIAARTPAAVALQAE